MQRILENSLIYRFFAVIFSWFGRQWEKSVIVSRFLSPGIGRSVSDNSIFSRIGRALHRALCTLFEKLRLDRAADGSVFKMAFFWCLIPAALAPLLPTVGLIALALVGVFSFILRIGCDRDFRFSYSPPNKFIIIFAFVYLSAIFTSVNVAGSLYAGLTTILFVLFAIVLQNAVTTKRQEDTLIYAIVFIGALVALYGLYQYVFGAGDSGSWVDEDMFSSISTRVYSTLQNPNVLSEYLLLIIPFGGACF